MNTRKRGFPVVATLLAAALVWCWFGLRATSERMECEDALGAEFDRSCYPVTPKAAVLDSIAFKRPVVNHRESAACKRVMAALAECRR